MRKLLLMAGLFGLMIFVGAPTKAQDFDPALFKLIAPAMRIIGNNPTTYLSNEGVQKELKLDEEQTKAVNEKFPGFRGFGKGGNAGNDFKERMTKIMDKAKDLKDVPEDKLEDKIREVFKEEIEQPMKDAEKILKPEQMKRLKQIGRQQRGISAIVDEAKELKLSDEQVKKIKDISTELNKDLAELGGFGGGKGGFGKGGFNKENQEKMTKLRKEALESAEGILKDDQKKAWAELKGEPFEMKFDFKGFTPKKKKDD